MEFLDIIIRAAPLPTEGVWLVSFPAAQGAAAAGVARVVGR